MYLMKTTNHYTASPKTKQTALSLWKLEKVILDTLHFEEVVQRTVDSILIELGYLKLGYAIVVLALYDKRKKVLKRIAISQTPKAKMAVEQSPVPFHEIDIPASANANLCIKVLKTKKPASTKIWSQILYPAFTKEEALELQKEVGIETSLVYPVITKDKCIGIMIFSMTKGERDVTLEERDLIERFTDIVGLAVQNSKLYSSLQSTTRALKKANSRLKALDKLKDDFVSLASHELRTPLTAIKGYAWLMMNKKQPTSEKRKVYMDRIYTSTERLIHLVNNMLDVSRIEKGRMEFKSEKMDIAKLAWEVKEEISARAKQKGIEIKISADKGFFVRGDMEKLREVLLNLVGNALKFTPQGGEVRIEFTQEKGYVKTSISDTGVGIKKGDIPKLFSKFGRLNNSFSSMSEVPGTGLGLFICKKIVGQLKGKIWVESGFGKGSKFIFLLPRY